MTLLCDTCSVLMLIRISPEMFLDSKYKCCTIKDVTDEIYRTSRFKQKYSWRESYKTNIRYLPVNTSESNASFKLTFEVINTIITDKAIGLSKVDQKITAYSTTFNLDVTTADKPLKRFLEDEFNVSVLSPLAVINCWIKDGVLTWSEDLERQISAWKADNEPPQPKQDIEEFESLTGKKYTGT